MNGNKWDDHYARRARDEKWAARSVYKLSEIDKKFRLIRRGKRLLDLGCYPGSWSQYGLKKVGEKGRVIGIDLSRPDQISSPNFKFVLADVLLLDLGVLEQDIGTVDVVMSDLAPKTTGVKAADVSRQMALARRTKEIAHRVLKKKGRLLCKIFEGEDLRDFKNEVAQEFEAVRLYRSQATRKRSKEVYLLGIGRKVS